MTSARVGANGRFRARLLLRSPGPYHVRYGAARSAARAIRLRPRIEASLAAATPVGSKLAVRPRLVPAAAGSVTVRVLFDGRRLATRTGAVTLPTGARDAACRADRPHTPRLRTCPQGALGGRWCSRRSRWARRTERGRARAHAGGASLRAARHRQRLRPGHVRGRDRLPEGATACRRNQGWRRGVAVATSLGRDGSTCTAWRRLHRGRQDATGALRRPRRRGGSASSTSPPEPPGTRRSAAGTSTARWAGWDWVLWYPMYFIGGFAIHGYPSVPAYPASHGCVRIPMWIAPSLFDTNDYGTTVVVHL